MVIMLLNTSYRYSFVISALLALFLLLPQSSSSAQSGDFYSIDGSGNNTANPSYGQTDIQLTRMHTAAYADGISEPRGGGIDEAVTLPNPRDISNALNAQPALNPNTNEISDMFWQWGQFLDHDITLVHEADPEEEFVIPVAFGDPHFTLGLDMTLKRSEYDPATGTTTPREQLNSITAWMDASQVYGSDAATAAELRAFTDGKMAMTTDGLLINDPDNDNGPTQFLAGDERVNEQPGLTAMHTLFSREHNRLAAQLKIDFPTLTDEEIYQRARMLVIAETQQITFNEFLPILLGTDAPGAYAGYDETVNPAIAQEFAAGCYRFGHSMVSGTINFADLDGTISNNFDLRDVYFEPDVIRDNGIEGFLYGLALKEAQTLDLEVVDDMRNLLFVGVGTFGIGLDLAALNIQRGRDHGLPSYNDFRTAMGMDAVAAFSDIDTSAESATAISEVYDSVDDIDLWIGGLAENPINGGLIGETCAHVIADQFERIRDGDRFWNEGYDWTSIGFADNDPALFGDTNVSEVTLKDIINWNSELDIVTERSVMYVVDPTIEPTPTPTFTPTAAPTSTPTFTPTPTEEPVFNATVSIDIPVMPSEVGDVFDIVVTLDVDEPCEYPVFDITMLVDDAGAQIEFIDPDSAKFGPPVTLPFTYQVRATEAGDIGLTARLYGESFCGGAYVFTYLNSEETTVTIAEAPTATPTATDVPTETPTVAPTATATDEPTPTATTEPTATATDAPTATATTEPTATATDAPTSTATPEPTATATTEPTATATPTDEPTPTATPAVQGATIDPPIVTKLVKTDSGDKAVTVATRGEEVTYVLEVENPNDEAITDVVVRDVIDTLTVYQDATAAGADISFAEASNTLTVEWDTIPANTTREIEIRVKVLATAEIGDRVLNVASVTSSAGADDSAATYITVIPGEIPNTGNSLLGLADAKVELMLIILLVILAIAVPTGLRRKTRMS